MIGGGITAWRHGGIEVEKNRVGTNTVAFPLRVLFQIALESDTRVFIHVLNNF